MSNIGQILPKFDVNQAYKVVFNHVRPPYPLLIAESRTAGLSPLGTIAALDESFKFKSVLGVDYTMPTKLDGWQLPGEPTLSIRGGKRVIDTPITRLDPKTGKVERKNVLEEVSLNNYEIRIRGIIISEDESYPEADVRRLREIIEKPGSVAISNALTSIFNVNRVSILYPEFFEVKGAAHMQAYELQLLQDENLTLELELNEPERS